MTFYCTVNGEKADFTGILTFNGYVVGDRLLEDVFFLADVVDGKLIDNTVRIHPDHAQYFKGLNGKQWIAAVLEGIKNHDIYDLYYSPMAVEDTDCDPIWQVNGEAKKYKMVCGTCGSTEVRKDAWGAWVEEIQDWELEAIYDDSFCIECDCKCTIKSEEIKK